MPYRDEQRGYKIVYKTEPASSYPVDEYSPSQRQRRSRQEFAYDKYERRDPRDRVHSPSGNYDRGTISKTTYNVGRDRNVDPYARRSNVMVIDEPHGDYGYGEFATDDYEVIRPQRNADGEYVLGGRGRRDYEGDDGYGRYDQDDSYYRDDRRRSRIPERDRWHDSGALVAQMDEVRVFDDVRSERSHRGRGRQKSEIIVMDDQAELVTDRQLVPVGAPTRLRTAFHREHSPNSEYNQRSRSVGFYRDDVKSHDVTERRHERPGAEAVVSGSYLVGHTGDPDHDVSIGRKHKHYSRRASGDRRRRRYGEVEVDEEEDIAVTTITVKEDERSSHRHRRHGSEHKHRHKHRDEKGSTPRRQKANKEKYQYEEYEIGGPYPPQRDMRNEGNDEDDDRSRFSEYWTKTKKVYERR